VCDRKVIREFILTLTLRTMKIYIFAHHFEFDIKCEATFGLLHDYYSFAYIYHCLSAVN